MSFSDHFCDLNGDGKVTPGEEFDTYMIMKQASKGGGSSGGGSGHGSGGGCLGFFIIMGIAVALLANIGSCFGCIGSRYSSSSSRSSYSSYKTTNSYSSNKATSSSSTSKRKNSVTQTPGLSHSLFKEGNTVTDSQLEKMEWQGGGGNTCSVQTTKYRYDIGDYIYVIWVSDNNRIMKLSTTIRGQTYIDKLKNGKTDKNKTSKTRLEYDVDDFAHAEDFYDWYKDDFIDYEEAEEYYEEHGGY